MNHSKSNLRVAVVSTGTRLSVVRSDDNSGEGGGNGDSEEATVNNGISKGSADGLKIATSIKGHNPLSDGEHTAKVGLISKTGEGAITSVKSDDVITDHTSAE